MLERAPTIPNQNVPRRYVLPLLRREGHLQYRCPKRFRDKQNGMERPILQKNTTKICTNCVKNNHSVQDCRRPSDYIPGHTMASHNNWYQDNKISLKPRPSTVFNHLNPVSPKGIQTSREIKIGRSPNIEDPGPRQCRNCKIHPNPQLENVMRWNHTENDSTTLPLFPMLQLKRRRVVHYIRIHTYIYIHIYTYIYKIWWCRSRRPRRHRCLSQWYSLIFIWSDLTFL